LAISRPIVVTSDTDASLKWCSSLADDKTLEDLLKPGDNPEVIARAFTRDIRLRLHGDSRRIKYPD
jgi:hypothetical protein